MGEKMGNGLPSLENTEDPNQKKTKEEYDKKWEEEYDALDDAYQKEALELERDGWRNSTDGRPGSRVGDPGLERHALDDETLQPLPDGSK